jgi:phage FluMu gp28-like protein
MVDLAVVEEARRDPAVFARALIGEELWEHQRAVVESPARYRVICAGRRAGKTRTFGVEALHQAFARPGSKTLIISAGEVASKRMFADIARMAASSPLLAGSVADETKSLLTLTTRSTIECVPASMAQVRSAEADLLIIDEAGFVAESIWEAAEPVVIVRPGSRVLICSTPWGTKDHFFRSLWTRGMRAPDGQVESWHWPSNVSPLVDEQLLEQIRERSAPLYFAREYLAEFVDEAGSFFTTEKLEAALADYELVDPDVDPTAAQKLGGVVGGVDWGRQRDANALAVVAVMPELDGPGRKVFWLPWLKERFDLSYDRWIDRLVRVGASFSFQRLSAETNGVGAMPAAVLAREFYGAGRPGVVEGVTTTAKLKQDAFGFIRLLFQQRRLRLPRHPSLLKQLAALEYEMTESGVLRIAVPERAGHDDLAMSLALAVLSLMVGEIEPVSVEVYDETDLFEPEELCLDWASRDY